MNLKAQQSVISRQLLQIIFHFKVYHNVFEQSLQFAKYAVVESKNRTKNKALVYIHLFMH